MRIPIAVFRGDCSLPVSEVILDASHYFRSKPSPGVHIGCCLISVFLSVRRKVKTSYPVKVIRYQPYNHNRWTVYVMNHIFYLFEEK